MKHKIRVACTALAAAGLTLGAMGVAHAQAGDTPIIKDGPHVIVVHRINGDPYTGTDVAGCMIASKGRHAVPLLHAWNVAPGPGSWCGLSGRVDDIMQNGQAVWHVQSIRATSGAHAYVLKSHVNGHCLVRSQYAAVPVLHLWTEAGGDATYCGLRSADELIANGRAAWSFDASPFGWAVLVHSAWTAHGGNARLAFATPRGLKNTTFNGGLPYFAQGSNPWMFVFFPTEY